MGTRVIARVGQIASELKHLREAVNSLVCNLYHLSRMDEHRIRNGSFLVLTDRPCIQRALRLCMAGRIIPHYQVRTVYAYEEAARIAGNIASKEPTETLLVSRLVYARYYSVLSPLRSAGRLIVV